MTDKKESDALSNILAAAVVVAIAAGLYFYYGFGADDKTPHLRSNAVDLSDYHGLAKIMAENFVRKGLRAPASAEFSSTFDTDINYKGGGAYRVKGYVDSQNGFGAMLRNYYFVDLFTRDGDEWFRTAIQIGDRTAITLAIKLIDNPQPREKPKARAVAVTKERTDKNPYKWQDSKGYWHFSDEDPKLEEAHTVSGTDIYKWQDEDGNWHFSDKGFDD